MNKKDKMIVSLLRSDARTSISTISNVVQLCRASVAERLKSAYIKKYTALIDFQRMGFINLFFWIKVAENEKTVFKKYLSQHRNINSLFASENGFFVDMYFESEQEYEEFFASIETAFIIFEKHIFAIDEEIVQECFPQVTG
jgi:DNA-binding Lrp family transcriptional regulator